MLRLVCRSQRKERKKKQKHTDKKTFNKIENVLRAICKFQKTIMLVGHLEILNV